MRTWERPFFTKFLIVFKLVSIGKSMALICGMARMFSESRLEAASVLLVGRRRTSGMLMPESCVKRLRR